MIALSFIPIVAGTFHVVGLGSGAEITPDNARFFAAPMPMVVHIISTLIYCVLGAFQFSPSFRMHKPNWHRATGRILIPCELSVALSGLWGTLLYPPANYPQVRHSASPLLDDARLCLRPRCQHTGLYSSPHVPVYEHTMGVGKDTMHGSGLSYHRGGRMVNFA